MQDSNKLNNKSNNNTLILNFGRCFWGKCLFCGYGKIIGKSEPSFDNLKATFDKFFKDNSTKEVKIFGSGSFLDENQVPKEARKYFIEKCREKCIKTLTIESRPEFITKEKLREFIGFGLTIGIGLEAGSDRILKKLNKGFTLKDFESAKEIIHNEKAKLRAYILVNPPFVKNSKKFLEKTINYAKKHADSLVLINLLPHYNSDLFYLWLSGEWTYLSKEEFLDITKKYEKRGKIDLDPETFRFIPKFPEEIKEKLTGVGEEYLTHPHYEVWQDYLERWYKPRKDKNILLFLPCSYTKPYSKSKTHRLIIEALRKTRSFQNIHQVMISSPGVIPREFERCYPFDTYDWEEKLETREIKKRYIDVVSERIERYLKAHKKKYVKIFCYLKYDSESYKSLKIVCERLNLKFENLLKKDTYEKIKNKKNLLISEEALNDLKEGLED